MINLNVQLIENQLVSDDDKAFRKNINIIKIFTSGKGGDFVALISIEGKTRVLKIFKALDQYLEETTTHILVQNILGDRVPNILRLGMFKGSVQGKQFKNNGYIIMEFEDGQTLTNQILEKCMSGYSSTNASWCKNLVSQVIDMITELQMNGVRHCDLHTNNIIFSNGKYRLIDFGHSEPMCKLIRGRMELFRNSVLSGVRRQCGVPQMETIFEGAKRALGSSREDLNTDLFTMANLCSLLQEALLKRAEPEKISRLIDIASMFSRRNKDYYTNILKEYKSIALSLFD